MLHPLAQASAPISVNVPPSVINNVSTGSWFQPAAVVVAALLGGVLLHLLTQKRDRDQKLRDGYGEFVAQAIRLLRIERRLAVLRRDLSVLYEANGQGTNIPQRIEKTIEDIDAANLALHDADHDLVAAKCSLTMLLGQETRLIAEVDKTYARLQKHEYRVLPGRTTEKPPREPANHPNLDAHYLLVDQICDIDNMRTDLEEWLKERAAEVAFRTLLTSSMQMLMPRWYYWLNDRMYPTRPSPTL